MPTSPPPPPRVPGAAALAALLLDLEEGVGRERFAGRPVAVVQTGGNIDTEVLAEVLFGFDPIGFGDHGGRVEQSVCGGLKFGNDLAFFQRMKNSAKSRCA